MFYDDDADLSPLDGKTVAIIGYGSQGHAHALNLTGLGGVGGGRPALRSRAAWPRPREHGLARRRAGRRRQRGRRRDDAGPRRAAPRACGSRASRTGSPPATCSLFGHGFSIHYGEVVPPPGRRRGAGRAQRDRGTWSVGSTSRGRGCPGSVAVDQDASGQALALALAYAKGIGCTRGGVIETTFKDETETDLFGEQAVLCRGVTELVRAGYDTLTDAGYDPRLRWVRVSSTKLSLIVDLMYEKGIAGMRYSIFEHRVSTAILPAGR